MSGINISFANPPGGGGGGTVTGADNGLTDNANIVELGGAVIKNTTVDTGKTNTLLFGNATEQQAVIATAASVFVAYLRSVNAPLTAYIAADGVNGATFKMFKNALFQELRLTGAQMLVTDSANTKGLEYAADYSANYTARSIPDVNYLQSLVNGFLPEAGGTMTGAILFHIGSIYSYLDQNVLRLGINNGSAGTEVQIKSQAGDAYMYSTTNTWHFQDLGSSIDWLIITNNFALPAGDAYTVLVRQQTPGTGQYTMREVPASTFGNTTLAKIDVGANNGTQTILSYALPSATDQIIQVNAYTCIRNFTSGSVQMSIHYTDMNGTAKAINLGASLTALGDTQAPATVIKCQRNTTLSLVCTLAGTLVYDAGAIFTLLL